GGHQRADSGAAGVLHLRRLEAFRLRRPQPAWPGLGAVLHQDQDGHLALAERRQGGRGVRDADDEVGGGRASPNPRARTDGGQGSARQGRMGRAATTRRRIRPMSRMPTLAVLLAAAVAEIAGCFAFWAVLRLRASPLWLVAGLASLVAFAW